MTQWMQLGQAPAIRLIELGPGRGTLMDDILRVRAIEHDVVADTDVTKGSVTIFQGTPGHPPRGNKPSHAGTAKGKTAFDCERSRMSTTLA
jgi:hypothetical protein